MLMQFLENIWTALGASSNQIVALAAMVGTVFAYMGLRTWQRQLKGTSEYKLAKDLLRAAYRVREGFMRVRNPLMWSSEYPEHARDPWKRGKDPALEAEALEYAYQKRLESLTEAFTELEAVNINAQVEWGGDYREAIIPLRKCRAELLMAIGDLLDAHRKPMRARTAAADERDHKSVLYHVGDDSPHDTFTPEINAAVGEFEKRLRSKIGFRRSKRAS